LPSYKESGADTGLVVAGMPGVLDGDGELRRLRLQRYEISARRQRVRTLQLTSDDCKLTRICRKCRCTGRFAAQDFWLVCWRERILVCFECYKWLIFSALKRKVAQNTEILYLFLLNFN